MRRHAAVEFANMLGLLFLLFTVVPLVELALLIWIGGQTAWWVPIATVLIMGIAGAALARWQGLRALRRIQEDLNAGRMPADAVVDGVLILVAGILLVTPGVLTDLVGVALLIPPLRSLMKRAAMAWLRRHVKVSAQRFSATYGSHAPGHHDTSWDHDEIIEAKVIKSRVENAN
jgi:UPF0716 protein FxsA